METNYWNPVTREYGTITITPTNGMFKGHRNTYCYKCRNQDGKKVAGIVGTFEDAERRMKEHGYERIGFTDIDGCQRYTMNLDQLQSLYKRFEDFVADCPQQEYNENKSAIIAVFSLIHKHMNAETYK